VLTLAIAVAAELGVAARLAAGAWRRYPFFALAIVAGLAQHIAALCLSPDPYRALWIATTPLLMLAQLAVAGELFRLWSGLWPRREWRILGGAVLAAVALLAFWSWPAIAREPVAALVEIQRGLSYCLAVVAVVIVIFFALPAPGRADATLKLHTGICVLGWCWTAACFLAAQAWPEMRARANAFHSLGWAVLLFAWAVRMRTPAPAA
jgi:hypothetical protein